MIEAVGFASGVALGFASSLHCLGMCGAVAAAMHRAVQPAAPPITAALALSAGRVSAYALLGATAGAGGALLLGGIDAAGAHAMLRLLSAAVIGWIGLGLLGLVPSLALFDPLIRPVAARLGAAGAKLQRGGASIPLLAGFGWGLMPCGMVYGALVFAMLRGTADAGALVMFGFGIGTLPAMLAAGLGAGRLFRADAAWRQAAGCGLLLLAGATLLLESPALLAYCRSQIVI